MDFITSAKLLDGKRLPNQRREAFQILCHIQRLMAMSEFLNIPLPSNPYTWYDWIRRVVREYKRSHTQLVRINGIWKSFSVDQEIPLGQNDLGIKFGYIYHPAVLMWLGFENALKEYLDAHIQVCISRGIKNQMMRYDNRNSLRPIWTYDLNFINRHRVILLKKELDRHEKPWYQLQPLFTNITCECLYFWPYAPKIGNSAKIHGIADINQRYFNSGKKKIKICIKIKTKST